MGLFSLDFGISANLINTIQKLTNDIYKSSQQNCTSTTSTTANNNTFIFVDDTIGGNVTEITNTSNIDTSCVLTNSMNTLVKNLAQATASQVAGPSSTSTFNFNTGASLNATSLIQNTVNSISELSNASCNSQNLQEVNGTYSLVVGTNIGGDFLGISNASNAQGSCSLSNTMKTVAYNTVQGTVQQKPAQGIGILNIIIIIVIVAIIFIIVVLVLVFGIGAVGSKSGSKKAKPDSKDKKDSDDNLSDDTKDDTSKNTPVNTPSTPSVTSSSSNTSSSALSSISKNLTNYAYQQLPSKDTVMNSLNKYSQQLLK